MKKLLQLLAIAGIAISSSAFAQKSVDNWVNSNGIVWKNGTNELCWRNAKLGLQRLLLQVVMVPSLLLQDLQRQLQKLL
jgi:hypothetical protein